MQVYKEGGYRAVTMTTQPSIDEYMLAEKDPSGNDSRGFPVDSFFCRRPRFHKEAPKGGSEAEALRVRNAGGPFIDKPGFLGRNLADTADLIVTPMTETEKLIDFNPGRRASTAAAMYGAAKYLSLKYGHHDTSEYMAWKDGVESVCPALSEQIQLEISPTSIFCDNILLSTPKIRNKGLVAEGLGQCRQFCFDLFLSLGFKSQKGSGEEIDRSKSFFVKLCPDGSNSDSYTWKISLADLPLDDVGFIYNVIQHGRDQTRSINEDKLKVFRQEQSRHLDRLGISFASLVKAIEAANNMKFVDIDLGIDMPGTLNCDEFKAAAEAAGFRIKHNSMCGKNCVKLEIEHDKQTNIKYGIKAYNKVLETLQQGSARCDDIACKVGYLLNPSTDHLTQKFRDPAFYNNGCTRYEVTFSSADNYMPKFEQLVAIFDQDRSLCSGSSLVSCSFQEHVQRMGGHVKRTVVAYWPDVFEKKKNEWIACDKNNNELKAKLNEIPDGVLIRYCNSDTGKFNGFPIRGQFSGRQERGTSGWEMVSKGLAWGASCGENPLLFICVAGLSQKPQICGGEVVQNMYFRPVEIARTGPELFTFLPWHCDFKCGNYKNQSTDWNLVGIDTGLQTELKFQCIDPQTIPSYKTMLELDIEVSRDSLEAESCSSLESGQMEMITGIRNKYYEISQHNGTLDSWIQWSKYKICEVGKLKTKKIRFLAGGDWYWIPRSLTSDNMIKYLEENDTPERQTTAAVRFDRESNGLLWKVEGINTNALGKCKASKYIPVQPDPLLVQGGGEEKTGKATAFYVCLEEGRYFLPQSIRMQLISYWQRNQIQYDSDLSECLRSLKILHDESRSGRVRDMKNPEEFMSILNNNGDTIATNTVPSGKRRKTS